MSLQEYLETLPQVSHEDVSKYNVTHAFALKDGEFLLRVRKNGNDSDIGFMTRLTKKKEVPSSFPGWGHVYDTDSRSYVPPVTYIIKEEYRKGWKFKGLRHGTSAAWVVMQHPFGFSVEINADAFSKIAGKITMVDGTIITPLYFQANPMNAELLVDESDRDAVFCKVEQGIGENPKSKKCRVR